MDSPSSLPDDSAPSLGCSPHPLQSTVLDPQILKWNVSPLPFLLVYLMRPASRSIRSRITVVRAEVCQYTSSISLILFQPNRHSTLPLDYA